MRSRTGVELTEDEVIDSPHLFIGSVDRLVEKFLQLREELGITSDPARRRSASWSRCWSGCPAAE